MQSKCKDSLLCLTGSCHNNNEINCYDNSYHKKERWVLSWKSKMKSWIKWAIGEKGKSSNCYTYVSAQKGWHDMVWSWSVTKVWYHHHSLEYIFSSKKDCPLKSFVQPRSEQSNMLGLYYAGNMEGSHFSREPHIPFSFTHNRFPSLLWREWYYIRVCCAVSFLA